MGCCGQRREFLRTEITEAAAVAAPVHHAPRNDGPSVTLRYLARQPVMVRGPSTGRHYTFSETMPTGAVDPRDAGALVRTGLFSAG